MPLLLNGGLGYVIGQGTRSSQARPNIAVHGDMVGMDPDFCGGFLTSAGPECITSIGTAIPVLDEQTLNTLMIRDAQIAMPIMDIADRQQVSGTFYDRVWTGTLRNVRFDPSGCLKCDPCEVQSLCPVNAIHPNGEIDHGRCFACGTCVHLCKGSTYLGNMGVLDLPEGDVPVVLRQSDRRRGDLLSRKVKKMIEKGDFLI
jgi:uncharacterized protein (DUF39 family)